MHREHPLTGYSERQSAVLDAAVKLLRPQIAASGCQAALGDELLQLGGATAGAAHALQARCAPDEGRSLSQGALQEQHAWPVHAAAAVGCLLPPHLPPRPRPAGTRRAPARCRPPRARHHTAAVLPPQRPGTRLPAGQSGTSPGGGRPAAGPSAAGLQDWPLPRPLQRPQPRSPALPPAAGSGCWKTSPGAGPRTLPAW